MLVAGALADAVLGVTGRGALRLDLVVAASDGHGGLGRPRRGDGLEGKGQEMKKCGI